MFEVGDKIIIKKKNKPRSPLIRTGNKLISKLRYILRFVSDDVDILMD